MTSLSLQPVLLANARRQIPNNLGPTLLLSCGILLLPILVGLPFVVVGLARIRNASGDLALPWLSQRISTLKIWLRLPS